jgi:hypothetical protein
MLAIPLFLLVYVLFLRSPVSAQRMGVDLSNYLSCGSLLVMVFTAFWFLRKGGVHVTAVVKRHRGSAASVCGTPAVQPQPVVVTALRWIPPFFNPASHPIRSLS